MARTQYFVVLHDGEWEIKLGNKHYGWTRARLRDPASAPNEDPLLGAKMQRSHTFARNLCGSRKMLKVGPAAALIDNQNATITIKGTMERVLR